MANVFWGVQRGEQLLPKEQFVTMVDAMPAVKPFRSSFIYSQWNYYMLHLVVEKVTGKTFSGYVREVIFEPLGLATSTFDKLSGANVAKPHAVHSDGAKSHAQASPYDSASGLAAASGGKTGLQDSLRFYMALVDAYQHQTRNQVDFTPGSPFAYVRKIFRPHIPFPGSALEEQAYCLGIYQTRLPGNLGCASLNAGLPRKLRPILQSTEEVFHHTGNCPGYINAVMLVPQTQSGVVALSNATPLMDAPDLIVQLLLSIIMVVKALENLIDLAQRSQKTQLDSYG
jgi:CubicO group peptidase (beta-lactamase class C family)